MRATVFAALAACSLAPVACGGGGSSVASKSAPAAPSATPTSVATSSASSTVAGGKPPRFTACGALDCRLYADVGTAVEDALADAPTIVGIGEAHAQKGKEAFGTSAQHFTKEILPRIAPRTANLTLELMSPPSGCDTSKKKVEKQLADVGKKQQETDADDYVVLGKTAQSLGITVTQLAPSCADFASLTKPGAGVADLLRMIKKLTVQEATAIFAKPGRDPMKMVVVYGGAFHTEPDAPEERADFSFAPDMDKLSGGHYASVHLFVREFVDASWDDWPWYASFDPKAHPDKVTMFHPKAKHWVILTAAAPAKKG